MRNQLGLAHKNFKTVDLFAGPGGLAEGFASIRDERGKRLFDIVLSIEKEASAFATLRLRSFVRQFEHIPQAYSDYVAGHISKDVMIAMHPTEWKKAISETMMLELGTTEAQTVLDPVLEKIKSDADDNLILIGGPPCQAYSLVGRARNRGIEGYEPSQDHRHFLYREYIRIIDKLKPVAFVMENVKGMLSARIDGQRIFDRVLDDLKSSGGYDDSYVLMPLTQGNSGSHNEFVIRTEDHGIPQCRHRVILLGIRSDQCLPTGRALSDLLLKPSKLKSTVRDVLAGMPKLRSGLSREHDSPETWRNAVIASYRLAADATRAEGELFNAVSVRLDELACELQNRGELLPRVNRGHGTVLNSELARWLNDEAMEVLPNHESRGHMRSDLARYAFAAVFVETFERSPKANEYPAQLAPAHENWNTGKFADRFRVQRWDAPSSTITSHISKDGHYFIHPDPVQCRSLTVREAARLQTFSDNYLFEGNRTQQFVQVGNAVPPLLAAQIAETVASLLTKA